LFCKYILDQWYQSGLLLVVLNACPQRGQGTKNWVSSLFLLKKNIYVRKRKQRNPHYLQSQSPGSPSWMLLRNNTTLFEAMTTYTQNGPHCGRKETKRCSSSQISSIPCTPSWVSKVLSEIWCSSIMLVCIDTSILKWSFWTSHPWARPTDMLSKSSRISNKRRDNLGLVTPHRKSQERESPTHRIKDRENTDILRTNSPGRKQRRTPERQRKIPGSGATSIRAPDITLLIATRSSMWWLR
jgi:hypothetical protein